MLPCRSLAAAPLPGKEGEPVSEYQYCEFLALDRPLTEKERAELRSISRRSPRSPSRYSRKQHLEVEH